MRKGGEGESDVKSGARVEWFGSGDARRSDRTRKRWAEVRGCATEDDRRSRQRVSGATVVTVSSLCDGFLGEEVVCDRSKVEAQGTKTEVTGHG